MARHRWWVAAVAVMVTMGCGSTPDEPEPIRWPKSHGTGAVEFGGRRVNVHVPESYDPVRPPPLVIGLHGYSSNANELEAYFKLGQEAERLGFVYARPEGTVDDRGDQFWNATDACCAFYGPEPDDSRYLSELIAAMQQEYRIDRSRVYLIGHSNGGFMAFRMACDHADQVTAIVSLNGATWNDADKCRPSEPVGVLAVHSSADETIAFEGGSNGTGDYPSAATTVSRWRGYDRCAGDVRDAPALDLVTDLPGPETTVRTSGDDCAGGATVESWTINGGSHVPQLAYEFTPAVTRFLMSQANPS
ncbi:alpha/beta fold hydrolase [Actinoplanes sp. NPDC049596]|uniref:alpha/beta hydrolase family esterase n=1 Tax=unclassified Actinoplanes TaxID=2626549 RepID=UPI0034331FE8